MNTHHVDLDTRVDHTLGDTELEDLLEALHPLGATVSGGLDERLSVSMTIRTDDAQDDVAVSALQQALRLLRQHVEISVVERAQVSTERAKDHELTTPAAIPELVATSDIAERLQVSRQAVRKATLTDPAFPAAAVTTSLGQLWRRTDVDAYLETRPTPRPGPRTREEVEQRALATLAHAQESIRARAQAPGGRHDPVTYRIDLSPLEPGRGRELQHLARKIHTQGRAHQVAVETLGLTDDAPSQQIDQDLEEPCCCEHSAHEPGGGSHSYMGVPSQGMWRAECGPVCDECGEGHLADSVRRGPAWFATT